MGIINLVTGCASGKIGQLQYQTKGLKCIVRSKQPDGLTNQQAEEINKPVLLDLSYKYRLWAKWLIENYITDWKPPKSKWNYYTECNKRFFVEGIKPELGFSIGYWTGKPLPSATYQPDNGGDTATFEFSTLPPNDYFGQKILLVFKPDIYGMASAEKVLLNYGILEQNLEVIEGVEEGDTILGFILSTDKTKALSGAFPVTFLPPASVYPIIGVGDLPFFITISYFFKNTGDTYFEINMTGTEWDIIKDKSVDIAFSLDHEIGGVSEIDLGLDSLDENGFDNGAKGYFEWENKTGYTGANGTCTVDYPDDPEGIFEYFKNIRTYTQPLALPITASGADPFTITMKYEFEDGGDLYYVIQMNGKRWEMLEGDSAEVQFDLEHEIGEQSSLNMELLEEDGNPFQNGAHGYAGWENETGYTGANGTCSIYHFDEEFNQTLVFEGIRVFTEPL